MAGLTCDQARAKAKAFFLEAACGLPLTHRGSLLAAIDILHKAPAAISVAFLHERPASVTREEAWGWWERMRPAIVKALRP